MSLYREASGRGKTVVGAVLLGAAVAMLALGFFVGRATAPEPTLDSRIADLRGQARPVTDALELVAIHYGAANATTREAARVQLDRAVASFGDVEDELTLIDPAGARAARAALEDLSSLVSSGAPTARVEQAAAEAEAAVRAAVGDPG
jgi:hypothetical protein